MWTSPSEYCRAQVGKYLRSKESISKGVKGVTQHRLPKCGGSIAPGQDPAALSVPTVFALRPPAAGAFFEQINRMLAEQGKPPKTSTA
jgi:hypothetical protein